MKRWSVLFLALALWALAGCGGPAADEGAAGEAPSVFAEASAPDAEGGLSAVRLEGQARPLTDEEIAALGVEKREVVVSYQEGDTVRITDGALESFLGTVEEIDLDRSKVRVVVSMFGRETPVELELDQVEPANS